MATDLNEVNEIVDTMSVIYKNRHYVNETALDYIRRECNHIIESNSYGVIDSILFQLKAVSNFFRYEIIRLYNKLCSVNVHTSLLMINRRTCYNEFKYVKNNLALMIYAGFKDGSFRLHADLEKNK